METTYFFKSSVGINMSPLQVAREILAYMQADPKRKYRITIGTDSEKIRGNKADFVTAIVVHRIGNGGRYFWRRIVPAQQFHTLRTRITNEVLLSLEIAQVFLGASKSLSLPYFEFEIHVDIGENGATNAMIQELTGMIRANNYTVKTKPDSYAASKIADRHGAKND